MSKYTFTASQDRSKDKPQLIPGAKHYDQLLETVLEAENIFEGLEKFKEKLSESEVSKITKLEAWEVK